MTKIIKPHITSQYPTLGIFDSFCQAKVHASTWSSQPIIIPEKTTLLNDLRVELR